MTVNEMLAIVVNYAWYVVNLGEKNRVSRKFIIISEFLKSFEVDSSHVPLSSEVKSSRMWSSRRWSTWGHFSLKSGHISVPQWLAGLLVTRSIITIFLLLSLELYRTSISFRYFYAVLVVWHHMSDF